MNENEIGKEVVDAAIAIHREAVMKSGMTRFVNGLQE